MKFELKKNLIAAALVPVFGLPLAASAQTQSQQGQQAQQAQQGMQPQQQVQQQRQQQQQQAIRDMRASELIGSTVRDRQDQDIGEVQDLIVDTGNQRVDYAILAFGGTFGFGEKLFAYPMDRFQATTRGNDKQLRLNVSQQELENAPGFDRSNWPTFGMGGYRGEVDKHFGRSAKAGGDLVRMSELLDSQVSDRSGNDVGQVNDVVVSVTNGQVRFVALEPSDALNLGDRLVMLPMNAIRATSEQQFQQTGGDQSAQQSNAALMQSGESGQQQYERAERAEQAEEAREDAYAQQNLQMTGTPPDRRQQEQQAQISGGAQQSTGQPQRQGGQQQQAQQVEERDLMLVLAIPPNQLQNARSFQQDQWPDINSRSFQREMDRYVAAFPAGGVATGGQEPSSVGAAGGEQQQNRQPSGMTSGGQQDAQQQQLQQSGGMTSAEQQGSQQQYRQQEQQEQQEQQQEQVSGAPAQPDVPPPSYPGGPTAGLAYEKPAGMGFPPGSERQESPPEWAPSPSND